MDGKVCLVTGANSGIGRETALALAKMGATVTLVARDPAKGGATLDDIKRESGNEHVELMLADLASLDSIRQLATDFRAKHQQLHVLVNNAGSYNAQRSETKDGFETTFGVNHLAYVLLTSLLLDLLKASAPARIINVSSGAHKGASINFDDLHSNDGYRGMGVYGQSKLANVLFTYELARRLEGTGVTANCLHPGVVRTNFGRNNTGIFGSLFVVFQVVARPFLLTPAQGAETSIYLASSPEVEGVTGKYFVKKQPVESNKVSQDIEVAKRLWQVSEEMVK
ncbi:MAG: SDR family oxidoreductase [Planctomycetes bacterium]|nr:SDR family oxidoreductase [Planctomycetota bacterium]